MGYIPWEYLHLLTCGFNIYCRNKTCLFDDDVFQCLEFQASEKSGFWDFENVCSDLCRGVRKQSPQHGTTLHIKPSPGSAPPAEHLDCPPSGRIYLVFLFHIWWGHFHREEVFRILELVVLGRIGGGRLQGEGNPVNTELTHFAVGRNEHNAVKQSSSKNRKTSLVVSVFLLFHTIYS